MRLVFAGTPDFAVPSLRALVEAGHELAAVYTQPDRAAGRGRKLSMSPVKQAALELGLAIEQPQSLRGPDAAERLRGFDADFMIVAAYGLILPQAILDAPRRGCLNVHASLLPRWRGAAPIQRALLAGDAETGITIMRMEAGLDTGPMLLKKACPIETDDTGGRLHDRLAALGAEALGEALALMRDADPTGEAQDPALATYASKLEKAEAWIDWRRPALALERQVRAFNPWPVAQTRIDKEILRIWLARAENGPGGAEPGTVIQADRDGLCLACGEGSLRILELQAAGRRRVGAAEFLNARPLAARRFDQPPD